ncbi:superfamily I DNA/RNA helicases [Thiohalobacter thiocyanaticus]|uniref:DNA 3'-5' helicase II n=1 Tax=Thiohalobacter thiocyanaticus TaxID=585455 RepID=A0A1Z4VLU0_9GAMM|nr:superfamily I DNA/RNA helicases [Thiohalobacter thiocyanaticus]
MRESLERLNDEWTIFHSVAWQSLRNGRQGDGEADFILMHPEHGLIVIEVKGGEEIIIEDGQWFSRHSQKGTLESIKNPFTQATASKYALLNYLKELSIPTNTVPILHGVCFPGATVDKSIGTYGPLEIVWSKNDLDYPAEMVQRLLNHWKENAHIAPATMKKIRQLLAPTVTVKRRLKDDVTDSERGLLQLTDQQVHAFSMLRKIRKALVTGGAGTGKTLLAAHRAKLFSQEGHQVLLVCYNTLLSRWLNEEFDGDPNVTVSTFHSLCFSEMAAASKSPPPEPDDLWWEIDAPESLVAAAQANGTRFDAIIVDEGQDFSRDWIAALSMMTPDDENTPFYVFADSHQEMYGRNWGIPDHWPVFPLDTNCRNTNQIAERVSGVFGESIKTRGIDGPPAIHYDYRPGSGSTALVEQVVERLLYEEGLRPDQITVLSDNKTYIESLREIGIGEYSFTEYGKVGVVAETIKRFKGLESDAVILVLASTNNDDSACELSMPYVGMSRAKSLLFVLSSPGMRKAIGWK